MNPFWLQAIISFLIQGDTERTFDITGEFNENIDMRGFEPGRIRLRLVFENAENVMESGNGKNASRRKLT
jgi:hypothetical protein